MTAPASSHARSAGRELLRELFDPAVANQCEAIVAGLDEALVHEVVGRLAGGLGNAGVVPEAELVGVADGRPDGHLKVCSRPLALSWSVIMVLSFAVSHASGRGFGLVAIETTAL